MPSFLARTLLASLACFQLSGHVSASPAPAPAPQSAAAASVAAPRRKGAVLSSSAQVLVNQTVTAQRATGNQFNRLAAEALLKLAGYVETNGWPSSTCDLDNVYIRREW
jgi:hypothetical protein